MRLFIATVATLSLLSGCAKDPSKDVVAAKVTTKTAPGKATPAPTKVAVPKAKAQPAPTASAASKNLSGSIVFIGSKVTGSHTNRFNEWSGSISNLVPNVDAAQLKVTVKTASAEADYLDPKPWSGKLQKHLVSDDFFSSEKFPTATFVSKSMKKTDGGLHEVTGDLTIRGKTEEIKFPATVKTEPSFSLNAEFSINRKLFGIVYAGKADNLIRDGVVLKLALKAD
tara:strand:- start:777 stop:1454 length:678 start_codon:yes stop_codon:yes gene_type:complete